MNNNLTEIVFILDRSGSMAGLEDDTIGGFNAMVEKQKKEQGEAVLSAVLFSDGSQVLYDRVDIQKVEPMTDRQYQVGGCTALLDAIGGAVHHIANVHKYAREEDRPGKTIFVITTDGMENASRAYTYEADGEARAGEIRLGVSLPRSQHGRDLRGPQLRHPCRSCREVQTRQHRHRTELFCRQRDGRPGSQARKDRAGLERADRGRRQKAR